MQNKLDSMHDKISELELHLSEAEAKEDELNEDLTTKESTL